jgi:hypothetical protein
LIQNNNKKKEKRSTKRIESHACGAWEASHSLAFACMLRLPCTKHKGKRHLHAPLAMHEVNRMRGKKHSATPRHVIVN